MERKAKVITVLVGICFLAALFAGFPSTSRGAEKVTLRFAHITDTTHPAHKGAELFKYMVNERTLGRIQVEIYPNSVLGSAREYTEQIKLGTIDMGLSTSGQLQEWIREYAVVMIPFLFDSYDFAHKVLDGPAGQMLADLADKAGFKVLANWEWGFRQITNSKRPIYKPEDLIGLKMRVPHEIQLEEMYKALGVTTTVISFPDLYMALSQKVVDGQCNPLPTIYHQKFYEVQKYLALTNHVYNTQMLVMSEKSWNRLSKDDQRIIKESAKIAGDYVRKLIVVEEEKLVGKIKAYGDVVTTPDLAPFREKMGAGPTWYCF
ncbi:MAG: TRAP transporter substrate-binding protein [Deltaproteobacteria bacterium]|nr:TRAP transporter substrate-binding protein [Deltaproteobacteria bacterium]